MHVLSFVLTLLLMMAPGAFAVAEEPRPPELQLVAESERYLPGRHLQMLEDPTGRLTLADAMAADGFRVVTSDAPNVGISHSAYWLRFTVRNQHPQQRRWWLEHADYMYQYLDVWVVSGGEVLLHREGGSMRPRALDAPGSRGQVFALDLPHQTSVEVYVRGQTGYYGFFPLRLWTPEAFARYQANESVFHGMLVGIMLAMIFYNLFFYLNLRETSYLMYVAYMSACLGAQLGLNGVASASFFPDLPLLCNLQWNGFMTLLQLFAVLFTLSFLRLSTRERLFLQLCGLGVVFSTVAGVAGGFMLWTLMLQAVSALANAGMLFIGVRYSLRGDRSAAYYSAAFGILILSSLLFLFTGGGGLPFNPLTFYSVSIGIALQAVLLTLALSHRVKQLKLERDQAEQDQSQTQTAMLQAQVEIALVREEALASQQQALEQKQIALDKERQLVEKERMANLGLLSAGIAHEINNPNNFMRVSVQTADKRLQDLRLYVDELLGDDTEEEIVVGFRRRFEGIQSQLNIAIEGSDRISGIVKSMRSASRSDSGEAVVFDPTESMQSTLELVRPTFRNIAAFDTTALQPGSLVRGFPSQLNQVFTNFIVNGCHAIEEKQKARRSREPGVIRLFTKVIDQELLIGIEDDGCGMSDAVKARLFQPFFTTKGSDRGTGLGLGICRGIVTEHGGRIEVESEEGKGTTFRIILPLA